MGLCFFRQMMIQQPWRDPKTLQIYIQISGKTLTVVIKVKYTCCGILMYPQSGDLALSDCPCLPKARPPGATRYSVSFKEGSSCGSPWMIPSCLLQCFRWSASICSQAKHLPPMSADTIKKIHWVLFCFDWPSLWTLVQAGKRSFLWWVGTLTHLFDSNVVTNNNYTLCLSLDKWDWCYCSCLVSSAGSVWRLKKGI